MLLYPEGVMQLSPGLHAQRATLGHMADRRSSVENHVSFCADVDETETHGRSFRGKTANGVRGHRRLARTICVADGVKELKTVSSIWVKDEPAGSRSFGWQAGYGALSVSATDLEAVSRYIQNQEAHHRTESFQDEFRRLLRENELEWDERYVWD